MRPSPKIYLNLGLGVRPSPGLGSCSVLWFHSQGFSLTRVSALLESPRRGNEPLPAHLGEKKKKSEDSIFSLWYFSENTLEISALRSWLFVQETLNSTSMPHLHGNQLPWVMQILNVVSAQGQMCGHQNDSSSILGAPGCSSELKFSLVNSDHSQLSLNSPGKLKHQVRVEFLGCFCFSSYPREAGSI